MPNNHMGSNPDLDIVLPRMPIANDPGFDVIRTLDGRIAGGDTSDELDACDKANIHQVHGGASYDGS